MVQVFREVPDGPFASADERFMYGSIGGENAAGIPYWIYAVLPRMFSEVSAGSGRLCVAGSPGRRAGEMPVGFTKKVVGFPRAATPARFVIPRRTAPVRIPHPGFVAAGPGHTSNVQGFSVSCGTV